MHLAQDGASAVGVEGYDGQRQERHSTERHHGAAFAVIDLRGDGSTDESGYVRSVAAVVVRRSDSHEDPAAVRIAPDGPSCRKEMGMLS